jgi:hypothetical protein
LFSFNKTEAININAFSPEDRVENPLAPAKGPDTFDSAKLIDKFRELPTNVKIGGLAGLIILLILIVFGR